MKHVARTKNPEMKFLIRVKEGIFMRPSNCYIYKTRNITSSQDEAVSKLLNIPEKQYRKFLVEQFNGQLMTLDDYNEQGKKIKKPLVFFKKEEDVKTAMEWVESITIMVNQVLISNW